MMSTKTTKFDLHHIKMNSQNAINSPLFNGYVPNSVAYIGTTQPQEKEKIF